MTYYLDVFFIYSMVGYVVETLLKTFVFHNMHNGILYGPWVPIYGFGCCIVTIILKFISSKVRVNKLSKIFLVFLLSMFVLTCVELLGGTLIEALTGEVYWSYEHLEYNFGHYISVEMSLLWGVLSLFVIYFIKPISDKIIKKIPNIVTYLVLVVFIVDVLFTFLLT